MLSRSKERFPEKFFTSSTGGRRIKLRDEAFGFFPFALQTLTTNTHSHEQRETVVLAGVCPWLPVAVRNNPSHATVSHPSEVGRLQATTDSIEAQKSLVEAS